MLTRKSASNFIMSSLSISISQRNNRLSTSVLVIINFGRFKVSLSPGLRTWGES